MDQGYQMGGEDKEEKEEERSGHVFAGYCQQPSSGRRSIEGDQPDDAFAIIRPLLPRLRPSNPTCAQ